MYKKLVVIVLISQGKENNTFSIQIYNSPRTDLRSITDNQSLQTFVKIIKTF